MKKSYIILLLFVFLLTGCFGTVKKNGNDENKIENYKDIIYKDENTGYKTKFAFPESEKYEIKSTDNSGKYTEITIVNEELNIELEMYYTTNYEGGFESFKENRINSEGFKDYNWNKYMSYSYGATNDKINFVSLLDTSRERNEDFQLFGTVSLIDLTKNDNIIDVFNGEKFQNFMDTMVFER